MAAYKDRLKADLDRWIAAGLVGADKRDAILASIPEARRMDAATALAAVGALLAGIAVIAFVAANWEIMPKLGRFAVIVAGFLALSGAAAWAAHAQRPAASNLLLLVAVLVFAAAIGLTGQIFDIAGSPRTAAYAAGAAALALGMAGRSTAALTAALVFVAFGDFAERPWFAGSDAEAPWMLIAAPLGAYLALRWGSAALTHVSALAGIYCFAWFAGSGEAEAARFFFIALLLGAAAAAARWLFRQERPFAGVLYGWFAAAALLFFAIAGYLPLFGNAGEMAAQVSHRIVWLAAAGGLIALGRHDRHAMITAVGVFALIAGVSALLLDLGLHLLTAAAVLLVCALAALAAGLALRRSARAR